MKNREFDAENRKIVINEKIMRKWNKLMFKFSFGLL